MDQCLWIFFHCKKGSDDLWFCAACCSAIFSFAPLNNNYLSAISSDLFNKNNKKQVETKDTSLLLNPSPNLALLFNRFNNIRPEMNDDRDNVVNFKYYSINQIQSLKTANKSKSRSMFNINVYSLNKNFDDLKYLLKCTNKKLEIIAVTETRITRNAPNYVTLAVESTPAK